ncbi:AAA family ATPase [Candidatus Woesearchaeota archaeon]|jgi:CMP/dCMP kinase|nr:AAA family ATPase [Candidatus Woesearchaeota archaeon]MBT4336447.1 AAA family ATPase [Candidatus Woesearchaeota archaeon]MBT4469860.1 AAA family ATPase [Candidatus Woesearchaeota archaeon]MBT6744469.1 AAA family ATPase [Candidatus Woesearchaeota archaeon]
MIITISGALGSGKSTVAKILVEKFNLKHYSSGGLMREIAAKRGVSLLELSKLAETDKLIDEEIDERQIQLGKEEDNFIIDARLGWHFIPNSVKIFLDVSDEEAARRIFKEDRKDEKYNTDLNSTLENIKNRRASEIKRYQDYYNLNYYDHNNYDLVVDTTGIPAEEVAEKIIKFIEERK